jgi:hypothetical protein
MMEVISNLSELSSLGAYPIEEVASLTGEVALRPIECWIR